MIRRFETPGIDHCNTMTDKQIDRLTDKFKYTILQIAQLSVKTNSDGGGIRVGGVQWEGG